jgi:hypothetical protein
VGRGLLIVEGSKSRGHTQTHHTRQYSSGQMIGLFAETSTWQHTHTHKRQTAMLPAGFEPAIPASERPQACTIEGVAMHCNINSVLVCSSLPFLLFLLLHSHCIPSLLNTLLFLLFTLPAGWHKYPENWQFKAVSCDKSCLLLMARI